ncbi:restriction endonuclease, partial [Nocardia salmonicida]|uniref:restriction endonuclease n=1 Tax=Nocardia salmonicida TaxID=53431 RepID=UPI00365770CF
MIIVRPSSEVSEPQPLTLRPTAVWPSRYPSSSARKDVASWIGAAESDDLLSPYLWALEGHFVLEIVNLIKNETEWVENNRKEISSALMTAEPFGYRWVYAKRELTIELRRFLAEVDRTLRECKTAGDLARTAFYELRDRFGRSPEKCFENSATGETRMQVAYENLDKCMKLTSGLDAAITIFHSNYRSILEIETRRAEFTKSGRSIGDSHLQDCDGPGFEQLTARVMKRDGLKILRCGGGARDHGADIIALTPCGRRIVVQCKLRHGKPIGPDVVYQVNGTARPYHNADIPVIVTTTTFSAQATEFAKSQDIHLIDARRFRMWATWGERLLDV